jgi:hypothetical protein
VSIEYREFVKGAINQLLTTKAQCFVILGSNWVCLGFFRTEFLCCLFWKWVSFAIGFVLVVLQLKLCC